MSKSPVLVLSIVMKNALTALLVVAFVQISLVLSILWTEAGAAVHVISTVKAQRSVYYAHGEKLIMLLEKLSKTSWILCGKFLLIPQLHWFLNKREVQCCLGMAGTSSVVGLRIYPQVFPCF